MSNGNRKYESEPIIRWTWRDVDCWSGKWLIRIPAVLGAGALVLTGTWYGFWALPATTAVNGVGRGVGGSVKSAVDGIKPVLDDLDQGTRTFGKQGADDSLQQQQRR